MTIHANMFQGRILVIIKKKILVIIKKKKLFSILFPNEFYI